MKAHIMKNEPPPEFFEVAKRIQKSLGVSWNVAQTLASSDYYWKKYHGSEKHKKWLDLTDYERREDRKKKTKVKRKLIHNTPPEEFFDVARSYYPQEDWNTAESIASQDPKWTRKKKSPRQLLLNGNTRIKTIIPYFNYSNVRRTDTEKIWTPGYTEGVIEKEESLTWKGILSKFERYERDRKLLEGMGCRPTLKYKVEAYFFDIYKIEKDGLILNLFPMKEKKERLFDDWQIDEMLQELEEKEGAEEYDYFTNPCKNKISKSKR